MRHGTPSRSHSAPDRSSADGSDPSPESNVEVTSYCRNERRLVDAVLLVESGSGSSAVTVARAAMTAPSKPLGARRLTVTPAVDVDSSLARLHSTADPDLAH